MKTGAPPFLRRSIALAAAGVLAAVLAACTGRGGGYLTPQDPLFDGPASFGFSFSCERSSNSTSPAAARLRIEVSYTDHGDNPLGSWFSIHGIVDPIDPVLQSMVCIGQEPPLGEYENELIFLGRYRLTTSPPPDFPCPTRETPTTPLCRFEIEVHDNDLDRTPSKGDFFSIKLSTITESTVTIFPEFPSATLPYARYGWLEGGNLTVD